MARLMIPLDALHPVGPSAPHGVHVIDLRRAASPDASVPASSTVYPLQADAAPASNGTASRDTASVPGAPGEGASEVGSWRATVQSSSDACLLIDRRGVVSAVSDAAAALLMSAPSGMVGLPLAVLVQAEDLGDPHGGPAPAHQLPPLAALARNVLTRGLVRVHRGDQCLALDVMAAPLHGSDDPDPVGVIAFLQRL